MLKSVISIILKLFNNIYELIPYFFRYKTENSISIIATFVSCRPTHAKTREVILLLEAPLHPQPQTEQNID